MFEALVERLLNKILGEYIENFSSENLNIGIWSGQVVLKNIALKKDIIKKLNLPFILKFSRLGCLKLNIPWKSLTSSKIQVLLEGLQLVIAQIPQSKWECKNTKIIEKRKKQIQDFCEQVINDFAKKSEKSKDKDDGYFSKLVMKIIDNLQVTIKDIHIRYEDDISKEYSFGVTLEELKIYTVNSQNQPQYIDRAKPEYAKEPLRKRLQLYNIGIYWNQKSQFYNQQTYSQKLNKTIARRGQTKFQQNYIILMTSQAKLLQRDPGKQFSEPEIDLSINLETLKLEITNNQLQQIITLGERLQRYTAQVKKHNTKTLAPEEKETYREEFMMIFPKYFNGWGKNLSETELKKLEDILEMMDTENFVKKITAYLQEKEKKRIIEEKKEKNRGWFSKPKELNSQEMEEIQKYLNDNFAQEVSIVKRPKDYYHINVLFRLEKLQIIVANTLSIIKEGLKAQLDELNISFKLREGGYKLGLGLQDISVKMFKQVGVDPIEFTNIIYKIVPTTGQFRSEEYIKLDVIGSPLDKPHLNTDIKLITSELMVVFYPKIIEVATNFADLKFSEENKEAAIQIYGQYREQTTNAVSKSFEKPVKQLIGADLLINSITIAVPFNPKEPQRDCWGLSLGSLTFTADQQTLKRQKTSEQMPIDVYNLGIKEFSFRHYTNIEQLQNFRLKTLKSLDPRQSIIDKLDLNVTLELYDKVTENIPKIKVKAILPDLSVNLNEFLYKNMLKMGDCFVEEAHDKQDRMSSRITEKAQIKQKASKIGIVYIKDSVTQAWKKYVAIMSENYIYLYLTTKDENYYAYYYIKNATLQKLHEPSDQEKPYYFKIKNNLNQVVFGFDKPELIDDWITKIKNVSQKKEESLNITAIIDQGEAKPEPKPKQPNSLLVVVEAKIDKIDLNVFTTQDNHKNAIYFQISGISSAILLHQSKKVITLQLDNIELWDMLKIYKSPDLKYFLKTQQIGENKSLINVDILQLDSDHPDYAKVISNIDVNFGTLTCNYKCQTVKALMSFFIPESQQKKIQKLPDLTGSLVDSTSLMTEALIHLINQEQIYNLKLNLKIKEISIILINQKVNVQLGKLGISHFKLYMGISQKRMELKGSLKELYFIDYSRYPNTIIEEQSDYSQFSRAIMKANIEEENKNMLEFDIQILQQFNSEGKKMLIDTTLNNLTIYYSQQPILRLITYLNTQMLPSFETGPKEKKMEEIKDTKPDPSPMDLKVGLTNISVFVEPDPLATPQKREHIQLNIEGITVRNHVFYRNYVQGLQNSVLVENYLVILTGMCIYVKFYGKKGKKHEYELTNKLNFTCSTDLIANPLYYFNQYQEKFKGGLRVECSMTPFVMRINQKDYTFLMKCLNWAITHDDGTDTILYDIPDQPQIKGQQNVQPQKDPFYLKLTIDCLSLFVMKKKAPIAFLILDDLKYTFRQKEQMHMDLTLENIFGTSVEYDKDREILKEKGMFNAVGYSKQLKFSKKIKIIDDMFQLFDKREERRRQKASKVPFLKFIMTMSEKGSYMSVQIDEIIVDVDVAVLLALSTVAVADENQIKGPKPVIQKKNPEKKGAQLDQLCVGLEIIKEENKEEESSKEQKLIEVKSLKEQKEQVVLPPPKKMKIDTSIRKLQSSLSDKKRQRFVVLELMVNFSMTNQPARAVKELREYYNTHKDKLPQSQMLITLKDFNIYSCRIENGEYTGKRQILKPFKLFCELKTFYEMKQLGLEVVANILTNSKAKKQQIFLETTEIKVITTKIMFFASIVDLLSLNMIMNDNLKDFAEVQTKKVKKAQKRKKNDEKMQKIEIQAVSVVQKRMKLEGDVQPIIFELVNDCNNNFMPVLRFMVQDIKPFIDKYLIKNYTTVASVISLYFFNPRSSEWQPIIEPFKTSIDYLILDTPNGAVVKIIMESSINPDDPNSTGSLKINASTQMLETILGAKDVAMHQKKKMENSAVAVLDFILDLGKEKQEQEAEVSPIVIENITNQVIHLQRKENEFQLNPMFKGPVKFDESQQIRFRLRGTSYSYGMDHYGTLKIGNSSYFIQFDVEKLSRIIRFIPSVMIQNKMYKALYVRRVGNVSNVPRKIEVGDFIPLDSIQSFSFSISGNSYTKEVLVTDIDNITYLKEEKNNKFTLLWSKAKIDKYLVYEICPPFIIHNCIPKDIEIQFVSKAATKHTKTIMNQGSHQVCASENISKLQFRLNIQGFGWSKLFKYSQQKDGLQQSFVLEDVQGAVSHINYVFSKSKQLEQYALTVYCKKLIVNELKEKLIVYGNSAQDEQEKKETDKYVMLGGQQRSKQETDDKVVLIGQEVGNKLRICGANSVFDFATEIPIGGLGESTSRIIIDRQINGKICSVFTIIGVQITLMKMSPNCDIFCKKIVLKSKGIIFNNTKRDLIIKEERASSFSSIVGAGKRENAIFGLPQIKTKKQSGFLIKASDLEKSQVFYMPESGSTFFKNKKVGEESFVYHQINVTTAEGYKFYEITQIKEEQLPYQVCSKSPFLTVKLPEINKTIDHKKSHFFMKEGPPNDSIQVTLIINHQESVNQVTMKVSPDDMNFRKSQKILVQGDFNVGQMAVEVYTTFNDKTKTIVVDVLHISEEQQTEEKEVSYIQVLLPEIILSINQNSHKIAHPYQSMVITLKRFIFIMDESDKRTKYQLKLGFMQIDQAYPYITSSPVIITPYKFEEFTRVEKPESVFNSMMIINKAFKENTFIDEISVDFNDIVVKFSLDFLNLVTQISKQFADIMNYENKSYYINKDIEKWKKIEIPKQGHKTFIKSINISPFYIDLSAELNLKKLGLQNNQLLNTILSAVGVVVSNIEDAPIHLSGMSITNCIDTSEGLTQKVISQYKGDVISQFYKIFGSLNIIGNPMGLLRNISTGFEDFAEKPAKGFVNGPAEFGKGIIQGTGSLVAHSVGGAFNSLAKITGTVSTGLATLSFDDEFEEHRAKEKMNKPKNVLQGLQKGGKAMLYGFKEGITGLFTQPYQNARKEGALGFIKGAAKGLAGVVVKPVTGVIDFASKATQGIKNNALIFQDKANEDRMRYPRVFYTECHILREYEKIDSTVQYILMKSANEGKFNDCAFIDCFPAEKGEEFIVVLKEYLVYVNIQKKKVLWSLGMGSFQLMNIAGKNLLSVKRKKKGGIFEKNEYDLLMESNQDRQSVVDLVGRIEKELHDL